MVDVVDENDVVVGRVPRSVMRRERLRHRAVFVLVRNPVGDVLVHRRSELKDVWPGWWDIAIGGVVASGETYDEAARRELREEAGIKGKPEFVRSGVYEDQEVSLVARCYDIVHQGLVEPVDGEVVEFRWVTPSDLRILVATERFLPDSLTLLGDRLFGV